MKASARILFSPGGLADWYLCGQDSGEYGDDDYND